MIFQSKSTSTIAISAQSEQGVKSDTHRAWHGVLKLVFSAKSGDPSVFIVCAEKDGIVPLRLLEEQR